MHVDVVVLQHGSHLVKRCIFFVERLVRFRLPHLAQQPFARFEAAVLIVLLVLVGLLQEQDANCESKHDHKGANHIREEERKGFEDGTLERLGVFSGLCENTA